MNAIVLVLLLATSSVGSAFLESPKVRTKDFQQLTGAQWKGTLTYLDYRANKKVSIPSNLTVTGSNENKLSWVFDYQYPDEPKANSRDTVTMSKDGKIIDGETVVERVKLAEDTVRLVTEKSGKDNDKTATFRFTYLISRKRFSIKKEVRYEGANEFFERNEYSWER